MTDRTKRRLATVAVALLIMSAVIGTALWSQRLTAEERAYAGTWYSPTRVGVRTVMLTKTRSLIFVSGGPSNPTDDDYRCRWSVRDGTLMLDVTYRQSNVDRVTTLLRGATPADATFMSSTFVATSDSRPEGPLKLTRPDASQLKLFRSRRLAEATAAESARDIEHVESPAVEER